MDNFEHFQFRIASGRNWDLYIVTTGFAFLKLWPSGIIAKKYYPNKEGYIFIGKQKINFKRLLYKIVYPKVDLKNKVVFKIGPIYDITCLYALNRNEFINFKKHNLMVNKDQLLGFCQLRVREINFE